MDLPHFDAPPTDVLPRGEAGRVALKLVVVSGPDAGGELPLEAGTYRIGKGSGNDLSLSDGAVSRNHLEAAVLDGGVRFRDLDSTNGSTCNGARFRELEGGPGMVVKLGQTELRLVAAGTTGTLAPSQHDHFGRLYGSNVAMRQVFALLERVAPTDAAVLLEGETGTGKELGAEALHQHSGRASGPFVVVDLAGIPPNLIESELFGHVRGAYTGAVKDRAGAFERADKGTVFLDEIGELPLELQPRLLRALESRQTKRVGANEYRSFDARVITATHRDLPKEIRGGRFREDLFHRVAVVRATIPPLRARRDDLPILVQQLLKSLGRELPLGPQTLAQLASYDWPGNIRELRNVVHRAVSLSQGSEEVPSEILAIPQDSPGKDPLPGEALPFKEAKERLVHSFENDYLKALLARCSGNVSQAAREAGIDRVYLHRLLKKHDIGG